MRDEAGRQQDYLSGESFLQVTLSGPTARRKRREKPRAAKMRVAQARAQLADIERS